MASIDFSWFGGENWFRKTPNPISPINLISFTTATKLISLNPLSMIFYTLRAAEFLDLVLVMRKVCAESDKNRNGKMAAEKKMDFKNPIVEFLRRVEEIADYENEKEDCWKNLMITSGFLQSPHPPCRPIDVAQAIGYKRLEQRYYDFIMRSGDWYHKDRLAVKTAWGAGIFDKDKIGGEDMDEWASIHMVYGLEREVVTREGLPLWLPFKGEEKTTYKQLLEEAIASKNLEFTILEASDGVCGSELTKILEGEDHMPIKYISKDLSDILFVLQEIIAKKNPCLKPWEVLSIQQANDQIASGGIWYCERLGSNATGPPYLRNWNKYVKSYRVYNKLAQAIPRFREVMRKVPAESDKKQNGKMAAEDNGT
ncbi:hypothetical protein MKW92_052260 [Papaver armeniacum]|nr:hypothetical protein MKW92_052260 [Papaver armeniacum]